MNDGNWQLNLEMLAGRKNGKSGTHMKLSWVD